LKPSEKPQRIGDDMSDEALLAHYVELERFTETNGESWADGFVRVQFKKAVLERMGGDGAQVDADLLSGLYHRFPTRHDEPPLCVVCGTPSLSPGKYGEFCRPLLMKLLRKQRNSHE